MGASEPNDEESAQLISDRDRTGNLPSSAQQAHHSPGFKPSAPGFADPRNTGPDVPTQARSIAIHMHMCMLGISIFWIWAIFNSFASGNADLGLYCLPSYFYGGLTGLYAARNPSVPVCALHLLWLSVGYVATEVMWCVVVFGFGMVSSANLVGYYPISLVLWGMAGFVFLAKAAALRAEVGRAKWVSSAPNVPAESFRAWRPKFRMTIVVLGLLNLLFFGWAAVNSLTCHNGSCFDLGLICFPLYFTASVVGHVLADTPRLAVAQAFVGWQVLGLLSVVVTYTYALYAAGFNWNHALMLPAWALVGGYYLVQGFQMLSDLKGSGTAGATDSRAA